MHVEAILEIIAEYDLTQCVNATIVIASQATRKPKEPTMNTEARNYEAAEREMEALELETGRTCKIVTDGKGNYQAVVIGSCGHFDSGASRGTFDSVSLIAG